MPDLHRSLRTAARNLAVNVLAYGTQITSRLEGPMSRPRVHFLYFHDVEERHLGKFRELLSWCAARGTFTSYSDSCSKLEVAIPDSPIYNVSFDDGFASCVAASKVMDEFGIRGCFFVNPAAIGTTRAAGREFSIGRIRTRPTEFMSWEELEDLKRRGHEIANHTLRHTNLGSPDFPLEEEIGRSREILLERFGVCDHFAWPFGLPANFSDAARRAVFASGHRTCASAMRGAHVAPVKSTADLCIRREHLYMRWPTAHLRYFIARSARRASEADNRWPPQLVTS